MKISIQILSLVIFSIGLTTAQPVDSTQKKLLSLEYAIFESKNDTLKTNQLLFEKANLCYKIHRTDDVLRNLERMYIPIDSSLEDGIRRLKTKMLLSKEDYFSVYYHLKSSLFTSKEDSIAYNMALIENLKIDEFMAFNTPKFSSNTTDSIKMLYEIYNKKQDVACERFYKKSKRFPGYGLFVQKAYQKALINTGMIYGFLGYGIYHLIKGYYLTGLLTGLKFSYQFYAAGARLSYNHCEGLQRKTTDEFKAYLYHLLLK